MRENGPVRLLVLPRIVTLSRGVAPPTPIFVCPKAPPLVGVPRARLGRRGGLRQKYVRLLVFLLFYYFFV